MKAKTGLYIRVSEEWLDRVRVEAGVCGEDVSGYVRGAVEMRMGVGEAITKAEVQKRSKEVVVGKTSLKGEGGGASKGVPAGEATGGVVQTDVGRVPAWKVKLDAQLAEVETKRALASSSGEAAPVAVAPVSAPRRSMEELKALAAGVGKIGAAAMALEPPPMKMQPQMPPKTEFYPDDEPNEEP